MSGEDFTFDEKELTIENMVEFGKMYFKAADAFHKKSGDGCLANLKLKIVEAVTSVDPQAGLALRAKLTANVVVVNGGGGQFNTTPPPPITGGAQTTIQPNPAGPADGGAFLEAGQGEAIIQSTGSNTDEPVVSTTGAVLDPPANEGPTIDESQESRIDFFTNNSVANIAARYSLGELHAIAIGLGLTIVPSHRQQQVAAIIKTKLKELKDEKGK